VRQQKFKSSRDVHREMQALRAVFFVGAKAPTHKTFRLALRAIFFPPLPRWAKLWRAYGAYWLRGWVDGEVSTLASSALTNCESFGALGLFCSELVCKLSRANCREPAGRRRYENRRPTIGIAYATCGPRVVVRNAAIGEMGMVRGEAAGTWQKVAKTSD
jgi:hypothetical protein